MRSSLTFITLILLAGCGSGSKSAVNESVKQVEAPKPADESRRFPQTDLIDTKVVDKELMGKSFMPGGTLAHYKKGGVDYDMFVARMASPTDAAITLPDWRKALAGDKMIPSFGGYFGKDGGRPVFVFSKGPWIAGVAGLPEKDADAVARDLAARLN